MGVWGTKVGASDQALNVFEMCCNDETYHKAILNQSGIMYYHNSEEVLCAIAIIDVSINGIIDKNIWSISITEDKNYMNLLNNIATYWEPRIYLLDDAIKKIDLVEMLNSGWKDETDREERRIILNILKERLMNAWNDMHKTMVNRRNNLNKGE